MKKVLLFILALAFISLPVTAIAAKDAGSGIVMPKPPAYKSKTELTAEIKRLEAISTGRSWQQDFTLGVSYMHAGKVGSALALLERVSEQRPDFLKVYEPIGMARFKSGDMEGALKAWRQALKADPKAVHLKKMIVLAGDRLVLSRRVEGLLKELDTGAESSWESQLKLSRLYLKLREPEKSLVHVNKAIALKGEDASLLEAQGRAHAGRGEFMLAAGAFKKASAMAPEQGPFKLRLQRMLADMQALLRRAEGKRNQP